MDEIAVLYVAREAVLDPRFLGVVSACDANFGLNPGYKMEFLERLRAIRKIEESLPAPSAGYAVSEMALIPGFTLPPEDSRRVVELCDQKSRIVFASPVFNEPHKLRLTNRIAAIEREVLKPEAVQILTESPATCLRCGLCLLDLTRVKSGRACLPRQARQPRQPDRRAPIYQQSECDASLACRLAASSNRVGRSPTGGPLIRPSNRCRSVNAGKPFCVKPGKRPKRIFDVVSGGLRDWGNCIELMQLPKPDSCEV